MGLDMYARRVAQGAVLACLANDVDPDFDSVPEGTDLDGDFFYWRKHAALHGWMQRLYREKGGEAESFNCVPVRLHAADLDRLEQDMQQNALPHTTGFFFGHSLAEDHADTREFITKARQAIAEGDAVFYDSWW